jgi:hypothetical protein
MSGGSAMSDWYNGEKKMARRTYEAARQALLGKTFTEFKAKAAAAKDVDDMWAIGDHLRQHRRELEGLLDYRYSQLTFVFGHLIIDGHMDVGQLAGLSEDKLEEIGRFVSFATRNRDG